MAIAIREWDLIRMERAADRASLRVENRIRKLEMQEETGAKVSLFTFLDLEEQLRLLEEDVPRLIDQMRAKGNTRGC